MKLLKLVDGNNFPKFTKCITGRAGIRTFLWRTPDSVMPDSLGFVLQSLQDLPIASRLVFHTRSPFFTALSPLQLMCCRCYNSFEIKSPELNLLLQLRSGLCIGWLVYCFLCDEHKYFFGDELISSLMKDYSVHLFLLIQCCPSCTVSQICF